MSHEINTIESNQGLRPRLPNRFEVLDANVDTPPFEEQQSETSILSPKPDNFSIEPSQSIGQRTVQLTGEQENARQPGDKFQYRPLSPEPMRAVERPLGGNSEIKPKQFTLNKTSDHGDKLTVEGNKLISTKPESLTPCRDGELPKEKSSTEKITTIEHEALRERHSLKPSMPQFPKQSKLVPRMLPVQALMPQAEKPPEPTIEIHIGRIEVRAQILASQPKPEKTPTPSTDNSSLQAYLNNRSRGARS